MKKIFLCLFIPSFFFTCATKGPTNKFSDPVLIRIADAADKRLTDSLSYYLKSNNALYRANAALAFASVQDTSAAMALGTLLLEDDDVQVKKNAAYALGQTGGIASVNALIAGLMIMNPEVVREVLESLGKTIVKRDLESIKNYHTTDTATQSGLSWAYYRLGARGLADSVIVARATEYLDPKYSQNTRRGAANFFGRSSLKGSGFDAKLIDAALHDPAVEVRMMATSALRKLKTDAALAALSTILQTAHQDYRVKVNAVRALTAFTYEKTRQLWPTLLENSNPAIGVAASESLGAVLKTNEPELLKIARGTFNWRIQANLYRLLLKLAPSPEVVKEIKSHYLASHNNYQKAWLLAALSESSSEIGFIKEQLLNSKVSVIKSSAAEALTSINSAEKFPGALKPKMLEAYIQVVADGDPAVVGLVCGALADTLLWRRSDIKSLSFLYDAKKKMSLPKDIESLQPLENAIAMLEGKKKATKLGNSFNHPINWELVKTIAKDQRVSIVTTKGEIVMRLLVEEAPGSSSNFVELMNRKYFDSKFFHRVVPNFVVQAGCNRGDGFGSEDYSIRSEFAQHHYKAGSVGMASAGKDTEGTQWFITHSATTNLDGRYTIFAEVEKGMDVVDKIEVGDQITSVSLK